MHALLRVAHSIDALTTWIGKLAAVLATLMLVIGAYNPIVRYLGQFTGRTLASNRYIEAQWYLFSIVFILGFAYVMRRNENVRVDFLYTRWSPKRKALVNLVGHVLFLIPFCIMGIWVSLPFVSLSWRIREVSPDPGGLARYPIKTMLVIAFALLLLQSISEVIKHLAVINGTVRPEETKEIEEYRPEPIE